MSLLSRVEAAYTSLEVSTGEMFVPPETVAKAAARGLELRKKFGRGGTAVGVARARDLKNRKGLSASTVKRMNSYFARHAVDKKGKDWNNKANPSAGYIAWLLWGGDAGQRWASSKANTIKDPEGTKQ